MLADRLAKRMKHLTKWGRKQGISCFRIYERDIPEYPLILDWYGDVDGVDPQQDGDVIVWFQDRKKDETFEQSLAYRREVENQIISGLGIPTNRLHIKHRGRQRDEKGGREQYERLNTKKSEKIATIFGYTVKDPHRYGVIEIDDNGEVLSIEEKPRHPKSNQAVVGLYFYPNSVIQVAKQIQPSARGELEITSLNNYYLIKGTLKVEQLGQGFTWLDTATHESLLEASQFIETIEKRIQTIIETGLININDDFKIYC